MMIAYLLTVRRDEEMRRVVVSLLVVVMLVAGWVHKAWLISLLGASPSGEGSAQSSDVVYHWVDQQGVSHFSQEPGEERQPVVYDGSRITVVEPVRAPFAKTPQEKPEKQAGHEILNLRSELEQNARSMSERRDAQQGI